MSDAIVVTEGQDDVALLQALLTDPTDNVKTKFIAGGGWSGADSLARSFLVRGEVNVVLVVDADTSDPNLVEDRKRFLKHSLGSISLSSAWKVVVIDPEIPRLLFDDRKVVEALVGHPISDTSFVQGSFEPRKVLWELLRNRPPAELYSSALRNLDLRRIQDSPAIRETQAFLHRAKSKVGTNGKNALQGASKGKTKSAMG